MILLYRCVFVRLAHPALFTVGVVPEPAILRTLDVFVLGKERWMFLFCDSSIKFPPIASTTVSPATEFAEYCPAENARPYWVKKLELNPFATVIVVLAFPPCSVS